MSLAPTMAGPRAPSPASGMAFSSNNPFRRAVSPAPAPESIRMSNNPFLDPPSKSVASSQQQQANPFSEDIFKDLSLLDKQPTSTNDPRSARPPPPRVGGTAPPPGHRPSRSTEEEEARRRQQSSRGPPRSRAPPGELDIFASPPRTETRRPRRNSESSIMDKDKQAEEDKRRRERRKEREARREKEGRSKDGKSTSSGKPRKKPQGLDLIDQLDVTGIYGQGLFHHDGPFDACNPHRNRKKDYRAPMQAFPTGSANNTLGGSGPVNQKLDLDKYHGRGAEGFNDYAASGVAQHKKQESFNPTDKVEQIHSEETHGLGTSTFLEGAPASQRALAQRRDSESEQQTLGGPGLGRKKSLAVRLRGLSRGGDMSGNRVVSPDARYGPASPAPGAQSAGGPSRARYGAGQESNPFFEDYDDAYEKKGTQIRIAENANSGRARAPSSPRPVGLSRSLTTESAGMQDKQANGGGFLSRMKSLKGGRRARPERRPS